MDCLIQMVSSMSPFGYCAFSRIIFYNTCINSKVSFQVIPAALEAIKDAEYEGTYIRPVSIQYFLIKFYFCKKHTF